MRISDWSSDVCSSDLVGSRNLILRKGHARIRHAPFLRAAWRGADPRQDSRHGEGESPPGTIAQGRPGQEVEGGRGGARAAQGAAWQGAGAAERHPARRGARAGGEGRTRSEEHTSELQSLMRISYAVFCLKKKNR